MFWGDTDLTVVPPSIQQPAPINGKPSRHPSSTVNNNNNNNNNVMRHSASAYDHSFNTSFIQHSSAMNATSYNDNR